MQQDEGYAWVVCAASFLSLTINGGFQYCGGILYIMFKENVKGEDAAIALVTSLYVGLYLVFCPVAGVLSEKYGERCIAMLGTALATVGIALCSLSTKVFHLYMTFSLVAGAGTGFAINSSITILSRHFKKYNKVAVGLSMCGVGVGSFIWPPVMKALEDAYGWRGAILMTAGIYSHAIIFTSLFRPFQSKKPQKLTVKHASKEESVNIHSRNYDELADQHAAQENISETTNDKNKKETHNIIVKSLLILRNVPFCCFCLHFALFFLPVMIIYIHFGSYVLSFGFSKQNVVYLYMTIGIVVTLARALTGVITGFLKLEWSIVIMVCTLINGIATLAIPFVQTLPMFYVYSILFPLLISPTYVLCLPIVMESVPQKQIAATFGMMYFITVPATILGSPLAAWLHEVTGVYASSFYLSGGMLMLTGIVMVPVVWCYRKPQVSPYDEPDNEEMGI